VQTVVAKADEKHGSLSETRTARHDRTGWLAPVAYRELGQRVRTAS